MYQTRRPPPTLDTIVEISGASCSDEAIDTPTTALIDEFEVDAGEPLLDRRLLVLTAVTFLVALTIAIWVFWNGLADCSWITVALIMVSGWLLLATCVVGSRNLLNKRKEAYLRGEADQFSEYVQRVTNPESMQNSSVIGTGKPLTFLWFHPRKGVFV